MGVVCALDEKKNQNQMREVGQKYLGKKPFEPNGYFWES